MLKINVNVNAKCKLISIINTIYNIKLSIVNKIVFIIQIIASYQNLKRTLIKPII